MTQLPERYQKPRDRRLKDLEVGASAFVSAAALKVSPTGSCYLFPTATLEGELAEDSPKNVPLMREGRIRV